MLISDLDEIEKELEKIQFHAEITLSEDVDEIVNWANDALVYIPRTGKLMADARYHRDKKASSSLVNEAANLNGFKTATIANNYIKALLYRENTVYEWADRLNAALSRKVDFCRTMISKAKEEMRFTQTFNHDA